MKEIYLPNLYRCGHFRANNTVFSEIPYYNQFNLESDIDAQVFMYLRTMTVLENILMFDRVYVDLMDLPIIIDSLYNLNKEVTKQFITDGSISFINMDDVTICCSKGDFFYSLAATESSVKQVKNKEQLKRILYQTFDEKPELEDVLEILLNNSKVLYETKYFKEIIDSFDKELRKKEKIMKTFNITSSTGTTILSKDIPLINSLLEYRKNIFISKILDIENIYVEDIIEIVQKSNGDSGNNHNLDVSQLFRLEQIPDIKLMLLTGSLTIEDIIFLKNNKEFKNFNEWIFTNQDSDKEIVELYLLQLKERTKLDSIPITICKKVVSFIPGLSQLLTFIDIIDYKNKYIANKCAPNVFIDSFKEDYSQNIMEAKSRIFNT